MAITRWEPTDESVRMRDNFDHMFNDMVNGNWMNRLMRDFADRGTWMPAVDVTEHEKEYVVEVEIPGMTEDDISLSLRDNVLTLKGEKKYETEEEDDNRYYRERHYGNFQRNIRLEGAVDADKVDAEYKNGVLTVHLPKTKETIAKQIPVKSRK